MLKKLRKLSTLQIALLFSVAVHAALLGVRFVDPEGFNRIFQDTPLEVILVNAKSAEKPDPSKAKAIAQHTLAGGGDAEKGRATTPLPASALTEMGDSPEDAQRKIEAMQEQQMLLLAQIRQQLAALPPPDPKQPSNTPEAVAREERRRQLFKLLAEIERRVNEENARPKKRYISPATREEVYAVYYDRLRRKIEDKGTENFPTAAGRKLYGELTMILTVNREGRVIDVGGDEVARADGDAAVLGDPVPLAVEIAEQPEARLALHRRAGEELGNRLGEAHTATGALALRVVRLQGRRGPADDGQHGQALWISDGTVGGTRMVKNVCQDCPNHRPSNLVAVGRTRTLFFTMYDEQLWKTDGTPNGTVMVKEIHAGNVGGFNVADQYGYTNISFNSPFSAGGYFYFAANDNASAPGGSYTNNVELWKSDGTNAGTNKVIEIHPATNQGCYASYFNLALGKVFFTATDPVNGNELWVLDNAVPTALNTTEVQTAFNVYPNPATEKVNLMMQVSDKRKEDVVILLTDLSGRVLYKNQTSVIDGSLSSQIDVSGLKAGMYILNVTGSKIHEVSKVVKE